MTNAPALVAFQVAVGIARRFVWAISNVRETLLP
jgi:hypothetical protein